MLLDGELRALLDLMAGSDVWELEVERDGIRVRIQRDPDHPVVLPQPAVHAEPPSPTGSAPAEDRTRLVTSPWVGVFHASVQPGDQVAPAQAVGIVEALRMQHAVEADVAGVVEEVLANDGHAVEYGQALVRLRVSDE